LDIDGAGSYIWPYLGYIEVELAVPVLTIQPISCLLLVTPDTKYSQNVPVILGTNAIDRVLHNVEHTCGIRFQKTSRLPDVWYFTFRCVKIQLREVNRSSYHIAVINSTIARKMMVSSNSTLRIDGRLDGRKQSGAGFGLTQTWNESCPFKQRRIKIPPSLYKEVRDHLQQLLDISIIWKSGSPLTSSVVFVRKKRPKFKSMCWF